jgi:hypothetical protein
MAEKHAKKCRLLEPCESQGQVRCRRGALLLWLGALLLQVWLLAPVAAAAPGGEQVLEDLQYQADIWILKDAARARVSLKSLGRGRYRAEVAAEAQGLAKLLSGQRRDSYSTEMIYRRGRLLPLVYREECRRWGKYGLKEYRFDYKRGRLELWQYHKGKGLRRKWQMALKGEPIYDPLSAFYNFRLGALGRPCPGETLRVRGIPYPKPEEIAIQIGGESPEGRKVMVRLTDRAFKNEAVVVFVIFNEKWTPARGWASISSFGKVAGKILPGGKPLSYPLPERLSALGANDSG